MILAIGVRPETALAKMAGIEIGERGGIRVDEHMRTSDPDIFAVGDAVEVKDFVTGQWTLIPLAGPANRQGRIAADVIAGRDSRFRGTQGTSICQLFEAAIAQTGVSEKLLTQLGDTDYEKIYLYPNSHAGYYPGAKLLAMKVIFRKSERASPRRAGARRGRRCQADRFLCHGDPDGLHRLRPGGGRASATRPRSEAQRTPSTSRVWSRRISFAATCR